MKKAILGTTLLTVLYADPWDFASRTELTHNGNTIFSEKGFISPQVMDYNGDGLKDLILGTFEDCNIHLYLNEGSDEAPLLKDHTIFMGDAGWPIFDKTGW